MQNLSMMEMLVRGEALDVRREGTMISEGVFELRRFVPDKDYCDSVKERWIESIGRNVFDKRIMAASDARYYGDSNWEELFLR